MIHHGIKGRGSIQLLVFIGFFVVFTGVVEHCPVDASVGFGAGPNPVSLSRTDTEPVSITAGGTGTFVVEVEIEDGWHVNARGNEEKLIPLQIDVADSPLVKTVRKTFPEPVGYRFPFSDGPLLVHEGTVRVRVTLNVSRDVTTENLPVTYSVRYQACSEEICLRPRIVKRTMPIEIQDNSNG